MTFFLFYFSPVFMGIALLASLTLFLQREKEPYLRLFPLFLLVNLITETLSDYLAFHALNNVLLNNISSCLVFVFYLYTLRWIIRSPKLKNVIFYIIPAYLTISLINIFLVQMVVFHSMTYSLGCLLIVTFCIFYFWELFQRTHSVNLLRQPAFWICSGLLFYYACSFPLYGLLNFITFD